MSKGIRLRAIFSVLAVATASLALAATAGASSREGVVIQARDACDPATFPAGLCNRTGSSGEVVTFDRFLDVVGKKHSHPAWKFSKDHVDVKRGTPVVVQAGPEVHTFTDVTATGFGPGCIDIINQLVFGSPDLAAICSPVNPATQLPAIFDTTGLFPGVTLPVDTSTPGTHLFQCLIHPWMQTTVTVE
jgi:hypothetical protein